MLSVLVPVDVPAEPDEVAWQLTAVHPVRGQVSVVLDVVDAADAAVTDETFTLDTTANTAIPVSIMARSTMIVFSSIRDMCFSSLLVSLCARHPDGHGGACGNVGRDASEHVASHTQYPAPVEREMGEHEHDHRTG